MFLTWNDAPDQCHALLDMIEKKRPDLPIVRSLAYSVHYLNTNLRHIGGRLHTRIERSGLSEPLTIPYPKGLATQHYEKRIRASLIDAVRSCTHVDDFQTECLFFLHASICNRFPLARLASCIYQFLSEFQGLELQIGRNQDAYQCFRQRVMASLCASEHYHDPHTARFETALDFSRSCS